MNSRERIAIAHAVPGGTILVVSFIPIDVGGGPVAPSASSFGAMS
jgi:hypothetical protein